VGGGYASFAVARGRAFTIEQRRDKEVVVAYAIHTGGELWTNSWPGDFREAMGGDGPRATPTWHNGRLYALGAEGEFRCIDADTGKTLWSKNILEEAGASNLMWGMAASPLVVDDKVVVLPGGTGASVVAYDRQTGNRIWASQDDKQAYVAPVVATLAGRRQLLVVSAERAMGLTLEEGKLLWSFPWRTEYDVNAAQPIVVDGNHVFISSGYGHGAALLEITRDGESFAARAVWQSIDMKNRFNSSVLYQGHIYGFDEAIFSCLDVKTGKRKWKGGRYGYGQVLLAGDRLIVLTEQGDLALVRATPERHEELARFSAIEGKTWNVPAIAEGILLVRNLREMAAFRIAR
jgi:outer membrane protein assembly factor BamB